MSGDVVATIGLFGAASLAWAAFGGRLERASITGPLLFAAVGLAAGTEGFDLARASESSEAVLVVAEVTLAILLFSDAARLGVRAASRDSRPALRVLAIGFPLIILAGWGAGLLVLDELPLWEAAILAAMLASTDAAVGKAVVESPAVPRRVRNALNIESGLNDGLSVPFFTLFLALAIEVDGGGGVGEWVRFALEEIGFGALVGVVVGGVGAVLLSQAKTRRWASRAGIGLAPIALALAAWAGADEIGGNGFVAAFAAGLVVKWRTDALEDENLELADGTGGLLSNLVFFLFGLAALGPAIGAISWRTVVYAVLSLTLVRMVPVAVSLLGTGFGPRTVAFVGWFGPRGLASIVLSLTLLAEGAEVGGAELILETTSIVVALSLLAHGLSSGPLARLYGGSREAAALAERRGEVPAIPTRFDSPSTRGAKDGAENG